MVPQHGDRRDLRHPAREEGAAPTTYGVPFYADYHRDDRQSGDVDAVVTTVPHYLHPEMGIDALDRGIHALVEKPVGVYTKQARELIDFAATKPELTFGDHVQPAHQPALPATSRRSRLRRARRAAPHRAGSSPPGGVRRATTTSPRGAPPGAARAAASWSTRPPTSSTCGSGCAASRSRCSPSVAYGFRRDIAVEDEVNALVDFGDGATGTFITCTHDMIGTDRLEILCDKGKIVVDDSKTVTDHPAVRRPSRSSATDMGMDDVGKLFTGQLDTSTLMYDRDQGATSRSGASSTPTCWRTSPRNILDGTPLLAPGADGIHGVRLANAIHLSELDRRGGLDIETSTRTPTWPS